MHDQIIYVNSKKQSQVISTAEIIQEELDSSSDWEKKQAKTQTEEGQNMMNNMK